MGDVINIDFGKAKAKKVGNDDAEESLVIKIIGNVIHIEPSTDDVASLLFMLESAKAMIMFGGDDD